MSRVELDIRQACVTGALFALLESRARRKLLSREVARAVDPIARLIEQDLVCSLRTCREGAALDRALCERVPHLRDYVLALGLLTGRCLDSTPHEGAVRLDYLLAQLARDLEQGHRFSDDVLGQMLIGLHATRRALSMIVLHRSPPDEVLQDFLRFVLVLLALRKRTSAAATAHLARQARESGLSMMRRLKITPATRVKATKTGNKRSVASGAEDVSVALAAFRACGDAANREVGR